MLFSDVSYEKTKSQKPKVKKKVNTHPFEPHTRKLQISEPHGNTILRGVRIAK